MDNWPAFPPHCALGDGWHLVDSLYNHPGHDAIYVCVDGGRAAVYDAGIGASTPKVLDCLAANGLGPDAVDHVFISHAHLDHCAGAGHLMAALPNATLHAHERCVPHLTDPARLVAGARNLYGADYDALYGEVLPVAAARVAAVAEGATLPLGGRELKVIHVPGHTFDHIAVVDPTGDAVAAGDSFGVRMTAEFGFRDLMRVPAAPTQFEPEAWKATAARIAGLGVGRVLVTHCGVCAGDLDQRARELIDEIDAFVGFAKAAGEQADPVAWLREQVTARWTGLFDGRFPDEQLIGIDLLLCSAGLDLWRRRHLDGGS